MKAGHAYLVSWLVLVATAPVPLVIVRQGRLPPAALVQLAASTYALGAAERFDWVVWTLGGFLLGQALLWMLAAWAAAALAVRVLGGRATLALVAALAAATSAIPVYSSPYHASLPRQTLLEVYR